MKNALFQSALFLFALVSILCSCQKEEILRSSSKVESQLESTWKKVDMTSSDTHVSWKFSDGKVYLMKNSQVVASGDYSVDASITRVHINTSGFPEPGLDYMNGSWKLITLDDDVLVIAGSYSGGTLQTEFTKEK
jgi:hypothetical protein